MYVYVYTHMDGLTTEHTSNDVGICNMIEGMFLNVSVLGSLGTLFLEAPGPGMIRTTLLQELVPG